MVEQHDKLYGYVSEKHGAFYDEILTDPRSLTPIVTLSDYVALEAQLAERVRVKALEWVDGRNCECSAETVVGMYEVGFDDGWWAHLEGGVTWDWEPDQDPRSYEGPGAAMAAAQADFERRILAALVSHTRDANPVVSHEAANMRDKLSALESTPPAPKVTDEMAEAASREYMRIFGKHLLIKHARLILTAAQEAGKP